MWYLFYFVYKLPSVIRNWVSLGSSYIIFFCSLLNSSPIQILLLFFFHLWMKLTRNKLQIAHWKCTKAKICFRVIIYLNDNIFCSLRTYRISVSEHRTKLKPFYDIRPNELKVSIFTLVELKWNEIINKIRKKYTISKLDILFNISRFNGDARLNSGQL